MEDIYSNAQDAIGHLVSECSCVLVCLQSDGFLLERPAPWHVLHKNPIRATRFRVPVTDSTHTILYVVERTEIVLGFNELVVHAKLAAAIRSTVGMLVWWRALDLFSVHPE